MERAILQAIESEATKRLARYSRDAYYIHKHRRSFSKRTGQLAAGKAPSPPQSWAFHKHFDPRYCINHSKFLARGIWSSLKSGEYEPKPALRVAIPKPNGSYRTIDIFSVPDAAVARIFLDSLRLRNSKIFSDRSYAYQLDKTPLDAVMKLQSSLRRETLFISQYDFASYFDSLNHSYLDGLIDNSSFLITPIERSLLKATIRHQYTIASGATDRRVRGTPQGNSLSLFLANLAAHPLDEDLDLLNGTFTRFADDSVVINTSYEDALRTAAVFHRFATTSGSSINAVKSTGIRLFSESAREISTISEFDFLGYKFRRNGLHVGDKAISAIKQRCSKIIYNHLLLHLRRTGKIAKSRIGPRFRDWDLVTCINELRSYIYGGFSQDSLDNILSGAAPSKNVSGAVSYFALVADSAVFRELDGWLANILSRAYGARIAIAKARARISISPIRRDRLVDGKWYRFTPLPLETRLPSFFLAWRAARMSWSQRGPAGIDSQGLGYAYL